MGDGADMLEDQMDRAFFGKMDRQNAIDANAQDGFWATQDGRCIAFKDINPYHRKNIIGWCKKHEHIAPQKLLDMEKANV